ncbi:hypothetical protein NPIL_596291 [Nephila pilipes]|uniref:Integrase catalytic domain-containing protein n=1 Tax=Nephila pilipes TaxID=299642 RepID=A0A8X6N451_NEPPI|nr:hypothetical protein NPIL_596291 [Nephila pilipes]
MTISTLYKLPHFPRSHIVAQALVDHQMLMVELNQKEIQTTSYSIELQKSNRRSDKIFVCYRSNTMLKLTSATKPDEAGVSPACEENDIEHRLTKVSHPWTNGQVERMNKTLKNATVKKSVSPATQRASL